MNAKQRHESHLASGKRLDRRATLEKPLPPSCVQGEQSERRASLGRHSLRAWETVTVRYLPSKSEPWIEVRGNGHVFFMPGHKQLLDALLELKGW